MSGAHACTVNSAVRGVCKCKVTAFLSVQVETIRDAYMVVAGVPNKTTFHAHHICDMALDMLSSIDHLKDPSTGDNIQIRVGERRWLATERHRYPSTLLN